MGCAEGRVKRGPALPSGDQHAHFMGRVVLEMRCHLLLRNIFFTRSCAAPVAGLTECDPLFDDFHDSPPFPDKLYHCPPPTAIAYLVVKRRRRNSRVILRTVRRLELSRLERA